MRKSKDCCAAGQDEACGLLTGWMCIPFLVQRGTKLRNRLILSHRLRLRLGYQCARACSCCSPPPTSSSARPVTSKTFVIAASAFQHHNLHVLWNIDFSSGLLQCNQVPCCNLGLPKKRHPRGIHLHLAAVIRGWLNVPMKHIVSSKLCQSTIKFMP